MAITIVAGNFKGGVGKTKVSVMASWELAFERNKKVLLVDMDPKGNASSLIARSTGVMKFNTNIFDGFKKGLVKECIVEMTDNLHIIPAQISLENFPKFLNASVKEEIDQVTFLKKLLIPIRDDYDYIFIDVPPTISDFSDNAMMAADYVLFILQAQELSLESAETYIKYLKFMADNFDSEIQVVGVLPVLLRPGGRVDMSTIERATKLFGEDNVMQNMVKHLERLKVWDITGITNNDQHDTKVHQVFIDVIDEMLEKLEHFKEAAKYE